jgi:Tfp pilus assembly protein PilV
MQQPQSKATAHARSTTCTKVANTNKSTCRLTGQTRPRELTRLAAACPGMVHVQCGAQQEECQTEQQQRHRGGVCKVTCTQPLRNMHKGSLRKQVNCR